MWSIIRPIESLILLQETIGIIIPKCQVSLFLPMNTAERVNLFKVFQQMRVFYVKYKVNFVYLKKNIQQIYFSSVSVTTSPSLSARSCIASISSSSKYTPYSSHRAMYSAMEIVPSRVMSARSNTSHSAGQRKVIKRKI